MLFFEVPPINKWIFNAATQALRARVRAQLCCTHASAAVCNTLSAVRNAPRRWQRVMRWIPTSRVLKPRSSSSSCSGVSKGKLSVHAVGVTLRHSCALHYVCGFSAFRRFSRKRRDFATTKHIFFSPRAQWTQCLSFTFGSSWGFPAFQFVFSLVVFLLPAGPEPWGDPRASPRMEASGLAAWTGTWARGAASEDITSTPTRSLWPPIAAPRWTPALAATPLWLIVRSSPCLEAWTTIVSPPPTESRWQVGISPLVLLSICIQHWLKRCAALIETYIPFRIVMILFKITLKCSHKLNLEPMFGSRTTPIEQVWATIWLISQQTYTLASLLFHTLLLMIIIWQMAAIICDNKSTFSWQEAWPPLWRCTTTSPERPQICRSGRVNASR